EFFVGIGDINAAFLPKKKELVPPHTSDQASSTSSASSSSSSAPDSPGSESENERKQRTTTPPTSPDEAKPPVSLPAPHHDSITDLLVTPSPTSIVSPALSDSTVTQAHAHDLEVQISDRPLQRIADQSHLQHQQERTHSSSPSKSPSPVREGDLRVDDSTVESETVDRDIEVTTGDNVAEEEEEEEEEAILKDDDTELDRVFEILTKVHQTFYREHDRSGTSDVASIIPSMKRSTLRQTHLVFSGLVALGTRPQDSEYWKLAETFGAKCGSDLREGVTHLVANQPGTAKVHSARRNPRVKIVYPQWLLDSVAHWKKLPEEPYLLPEPKPISAASTPKEPRSPVRPPLSDGEDELDRDDDRNGDNAAQDVELDMGEIDWGAAMAEMDDLLNETDDDATDREEEMNKNGNGRPKKRSRPSTATTDDESDVGNSTKGSGSDGTISKTAATESPLQKRVKTARSRSSGLKTSLSAAALAAAASDESESRPQLVSPSKSVGKDVQDVIDEAIGRAESVEMSQASSSISSDDEGFLASLEAELEAGFEQGGDGDEDE
ncbi:BRCT domain-containing protein, partial [Sporobolomyces koalae]|uniref:BRCT domain-containing protein n=1 Tax=Sporobolomyces koalae TaxID=500713 RepID=UPI00316C3F90